MALLLLQSHFSTTAAKPQTLTPSLDSASSPNHRSRRCQTPICCRARPKSPSSQRSPMRCAPLFTSCVPLMAKSWQPPFSPPLLPLRIPIVFEGDLANTADLHLKDSDFVFVAGSLRSDLDHLNAGEDQGRLQVLVHTLYFVEESSQLNKSSKADRQEERTTDHTVVKDDMDQSWKKDTFSHGKI
ncbi:hypothetical protein ACFX13_004582 [Malus domestica]